MPCHRIPALLLAATALAAACGGGSATPSFDPSGPCVADGRAAGAYPDLERAVPTRYQERPPDTLDSGRNCSAANLGSLAVAGIREVHFTGGTWGLGANRAAALVVFEAPGLTADLVAAFYATSARQANRTQVTSQTTPTLAGRPGYRLDSTTGDRLQSVLIWPADTPDRVNVVITNDLPDPKIDAAVAAFEGR